MSLMRKRKPKIYLHGWYGHNNSGDDALLSVISKTIAEKIPYSEIVVQIPADGESPPLPKSVKITHLHHWFKGHVILQKLLAILTSDVLVFGGGSIMTDVNKQRIRGLHSLHRICSVAKIKDVPIIFTGLGIGPFVTQKGRELAKSILSMAEIVELRDSISYKLCEEFGLSRIVQGFDPAVLLDVELPINTKTWNNKIPIIGMSLSKSSGTILTGQEKQLLKIEQLVAGIKKVTHSQKICVAGIEMCRNACNRDAELNHELAKQLENVCEFTIIPYQPDPIAMLNRLSVLDGIIAERLHAAIYAYILNIPFAVIPYHDKCKAFVHDVGLPQNCLLDTDILSDQVEEVILSQIKKEKKNLPTFTIEEARSRAHLGQQKVIEKLKHLLEIDG